MALGAVKGAGLEYLTLSCKVCLVLLKAQVSNILHLSCKMRLVLLLKALIANIYIVVNGALGDVKGAEFESLTKSYKMRLVLIANILHCHVRCACCS